MGGRGKRNEKKKKIIPYEVLTERGKSSYGCLFQN